MRVILEIDDVTLEKIAEMAEAEKRSRKNFMELVLKTVTEEPIIVFKSGVFIPQENGGMDFKEQVINTPDNMPNWKKKLLEYQTKNKK